MTYTLHLGEELVGEFGSLEGIAGELHTIGQAQGPFLSFAEGQLLGPLRRWLLDNRRWRPEEHDNGEIQIRGRDEVISGSLHIGPLEPVVAFGARESGAVHEIIFKAPYLDTVPQHAQEEWENWSYRDLLAPARWLEFSTARRRALLFVTRLASRPHTGQTCLASHYVVDGRAVQDYPGLFLAIGEAIEGPRGYMGGDLDALADRLIDYTHPSSGCTITWEHGEHARQALSAGEWRREGWRTSADLPPDACLFSAINAAFRDRGIEVIVQ